MQLKTQYTQYVLLPTNMIEFLIVSHANSKIMNYDIDKIMNAIEIIQYNNAFVVFFKLNHHKYHKYEMYNCSKMWGRARFFLTKAH